MYPILFSLLIFDSVYSDCVVFYTDIGLVVSLRAFMAMRTGATLPALLALQVKESLDLFSISASVFFFDSPKQ